MATIAFKGNPVHTLGELPAPGTTLPDFRLTDTELNDITLDDLKGKKLVLNIFPSVDTGVCAASVRTFNRAAGNLENTEVLCISEDLPFAHKRFCGTEGIKDVRSLSTMKKRDFGKTYNASMTSGPLEGLLSRAVIVADGNGKVVYAEQVPEIGQEPDYSSALEAVKNA